MTTTETVFLVRGESKESPLPHYASREDGFAAFSSEAGPLHRSRFRNLLRTFESEGVAEKFVSEYQQRMPGRFKALVVEPAYPELMASFPTMESEKRESIQRIMPLVDRVLETFDFSRVQKAMLALDWKYAGDDAPPTIERLTEMARGLLVTAAEEDNETGCHTCGGFEAWRYGEKLFLTFKIETAYAEDGKAKRL